MLNIGTLIFTVSVGFMLKKYLTLFEKLGLYNSKEHLEKNNRRNYL